MNKPYIEKLKDPRWQKKRLEIFERDNFMCQCCGDNESTLHVHHLRYLRGRDPWDYEKRDLITLCEICHEEETNCRRVEEEGLLEALSVGRYVSVRELYSIGLMVVNCSILRSLEFTMGAITVALNDEELMKLIDEKYLAFLKEEAKKND